jgi:ribonuclease P protein component
LQGTRQATPTRAASAGFSASARVRAKAEFTRIFAQGRRIGHPLMALHVLLEAELAGPGARLGLAVSRKVDPRAIGRNRIKRVLREEFRRRRGALPPGAYVVVARAAARGADNTALREAFSALLQRATALPPAGLTGTMPAQSPSAD